MDKKTFDRLVEIGNQKKRKKKTIRHSSYAHVFLLYVSYILCLKAGYVKYE